MKRTLIIISSSPRRDGNSYRMAAAALAGSEESGHRAELVGVVQGIGNQRGDVDHDPSAPIARARGLAATLYDAHYSDYRIDTPRPGKVW